MSGPGPDFVPATRASGEVSRGDGQLASPPRRSNLRSALRGADFNAGDAMLVPLENARAKEDGGKDKALLEAWDYNRKEGLSVAWLSKLQALLGVAVTGASSRELAAAIATFQAGNGISRRPGQLDSATRARLLARFPELAEIPERAGTAGFEAAGARADDRAPENTAVQKLGLAGSYSEYAASLRRLSFLGQPVVGHPEFLGRLANAVQYLKGKFPGKSEVEIGAMMGVRETSHFRRSTPGADQMYHGLGFALDVNPPQNNWHFGNGRRGVRLGEIMKNVGALFGESTVTGSRDMSRLARAGTTDELFAQLSSSNEALKRYRRLGADEAALDAHLASDDAPGAARARGTAGWLRTMANDEKWMARHLTANPREEGPAGFMDYRKELITALRDAGGLRWGGADLGGDNGDLMHFDGGTMPLAQRLRKATRAARGG